MTHEFSSSERSRWKPAYAQAREDLAQVGNCEAPRVAIVVGFRLGCDAPMIAFALTRHRPVFDATADVREDET